MNIVARFENGVFRPLEAITLSEGTLVEIEVSGDLQPSRSASEGPAKVDEHHSALLRNAAFGLWQDRLDISDGVTFVNEMRSQTRRVE